MKVVDISKSVGVDISTSVAVNATAQEYLQDIAYNSSTFAYYDKKGNMNPALVDVPVAKFEGTDYIVANNNLFVDAESLEIYFYYIATVSYQGLIGAGTTLTDRWAIFRDASNSAINIIFHSTTGSKIKKLSQSQT